MIFLIIICVLVAIALLFHKLKNINLTCDLPDFEDVQETINEQLDIK